MLTTLGESLLEVETAHFKVFFAVLPGRKFFSKSEHMFCRYDLCACLCIHVTHVHSKLLFWLGILTFTYFNCVRVFGKYFPLN